MKTAKILFSCLIMAVTLVTFSHMTSTCSEAATVLCECGNPRCGGCERGRILSAMRSNRSGAHASNCGCQECGTAAPTYVEAPQVISQPAQPYVIQNMGQIVDSGYGTVVESYGPAVAGTPCAPQCGCQGCRLRRPRRARCPQCECDQCVLKVDKDETKKSCFKVEQKEVCIPAVTLPWQKCCPKTTSKMRVVNVLKKHSYKCPSCKYSWEVNEPEPLEVAQPTYAEAPQETPAETSAESTPPQVETPPEPTASNEVQGEVEKAVESIEVDLPKVDDVPQPPLEAAGSESGGGF